MASAATQPTPPSWLPSSSPSCASSRWGPITASLPASLPACQPACPPRPTTPTPTPACAPLAVVLVPRQPLPSSHLCPRTAAHTPRPHPPFPRAQGLAVGGEFGAAVVYISELAGTNRRGTLVACLQMTVKIGMILATLMVMLLENTMSEGEWGGREALLAAD